MKMFYGDFWIDKRGDGSAFNKIDVNEVSVERSACGGGLILEADVDQCHVQWAPRTTNREADGAIHDPNPELRIQVDPRRRHRDILRDAPESDRKAEIKTQRARDQGTLPDRADGPLKRRKPEDMLRVADRGSWHHWSAVRRKHSILVASHRICYRSSAQAMHGVFGFWASSSYLGSRVPLDEGEREEGRKVAR